MEKLKLDPRNVRKHGKRNQQVIAESLRELGAGRSILIDSSNTAVAGNGVLEQAEKEKKAGLWKSENPPIPPWEWRKMKRKKRALHAGRPEDSSVTHPRSSPASCGSFFSSFRASTARARLTCLQPPEFPGAR